MTTEKSETPVNDISIFQSEMQNYKIKVANNEEGEKVQKLFFALGGAWYSVNGTSQQVLKETDFSYLFLTDGQVNHEFDDEEFFKNDPNIEITFPQLRDLVVLHRNDVGDATHTDNVNKFYIGDTDVFQYHDGVWIKCSGLISPKLKPIKIPKITWQDALHAVADGKEVEFLSFENKEWEKLEKISIGKILYANCDFRMAPQRIALNGNYTKEQLLEIAGEMV